MIRKKLMKNVSRHWPVYVFQTLFYLCKHVVNAYTAAFNNQGSSLRTWLSSKKENSFSQRKVDRSSIAVRSTLGAPQSRGVLSTA